MKNENENIISATKENLLEVSLKLFAMNGYEGVSTRQIVNKANVNISAITYYFGGKKGLYKAVIESKIQLFENNMEQVLTEISNRETCDNELNQQFLIKLLDKYLELLFSKGISEYLVLLLIREMNNPTEIFELFYNKMIGRMHKALSKIIASIFRKSEDDEDVILFVTTIIGQILIFKFGKNLVLKRLDKQEYDQNLITKIKRIILNNVVDLTDNKRTSL